MSPRMRQLLEALKQATHDASTLGCPQVPEGSQRARPPVTSPHPKGQGKLKIGLLPSKALRPPTTLPGSTPSPPLKCQFLQEPGTLSSLPVSFNTNCLSFPTISRHRSQCLYWVGTSWLVPEIPQSFPHLPSRAQQGQLPGANIIQTLTSPETKFYSSFCGEGAPELCPSSSASHFAELRSLSHCRTLHKRQAEGWCFLRTKTALMLVGENSDKEKEEFQPQRLCTQTSSTSRYLWFWVQMSKAGPDPWQGLLGPQGKVSSKSPAITPFPGKRV